MEPNDLQRFWRGQVCDGHKHFRKKIGPKKKQVLIGRFQQHALDQIDTDAINTTLDWGCGGGLLAKMISEFSDLILLDIASESLQEASDYVGEKVVQTIEFSDPDAQIPDTQSELLVCYGVIHHFPTHEYWKKIATIWNSIAVPTMVIQTKLGATTIESPNYRSNYTNGLILSNRDFLDPFTKKYTIKYYEEEQHNQPDIKLGFVILSLRD